MDTFWYDNYNILFDKPEEFFPTTNMNLIDKLNSVMRLSLYIGIILTTIRFNYLYLFIPIFVGIFTIIIYKSQYKTIEKFNSDYDRLMSEYDKNQDDKNINCKPNVDCIQPTKDNPFMNFNQITDERNREPACKSYNDEKIKKEINNNFNINLYRDVGDLYSKNNSQREYYTMPSTQAMNDQTAFAKWCFKTGPTCKEEGIKCAPLWAPMDFDQEFGRFVN